MKTKARRCRKGHPFDKKYTDSKGKTQNRCSRCDRERARRWYYANQEKAKQQAREKSARYRAGNPGYWRAQHFLKTYGITLKQRDALAKKQGGVCAVCKSIGKDGKLNVDHDHETGRVRGLLCTGCNVALGAIKEDPNTLKALYRYLRKNALVTDLPLAA